MQLNLLEKSILATIGYYDIFDYPLTGFEVFKYLINPLHIISQLGIKKGMKLEPVRETSFLDILKILGSGNLEDFIEEKNGLYFLKGKGNLVKQRIERQKIAVSRWKKVYRVIKFLQVCPFIKMIAVCNSLAIDNSKQKADIDFFIIIRKGRIWLTRFLITFIIWSLGQRRHGQKIAGRVCLSFYITDQALNLQSLTIEPYDIYLAHWVLEIKPVYWRNQTYNQFISENKWLKDYFFNFEQTLNERHPQFKTNGFLSLIQKSSEKILGGWFGGLIEKLFRLVQRHRINRKITPHKIPTAVVVSDKILKFHEIDRREFFQEEFRKRLEILTSI